MSGRSPAERPNLDGIIDDPAPEAEYYNATQCARVFTTTLRSFLRWVEEGRVPKPTKFGNLARWPKQQIEDILRVGIAPKSDLDVRRTLPPKGIIVECCHCHAKIEVNRRGEVQLIAPAKSTKKTKSRSK